MLFCSRKKAKSHKQTRSLYRACRVTAGPCVCLFVCIQVVLVKSWFSPAVPHTRPHRPASYDGVLSAGDTMSSPAHRSHERAAHTAASSFTSAAAPTPVTNATAVADLADVCICSIFVAILLWHKSAVRAQPLRVHPLETLETHHRHAASCRRAFFPADSAACFDDVGAAASAFSLRKVWLVTFKDAPTKDARANSDAATCVTATSASSRSDASQSARMGSSTHPT